MRRLLAFFITLMTIVVPNVFSTEKSGPVYIAPLKGPIDQPQFFIMRRAFREAIANDASTIIIEMDTPGGGLRETEEIISWIRSFEGDVYTYVEKRAQSAGAIICLGSNKVYMAPGSRVGSAAPVMGTPGGGVQEIPATMKEKVMSDTRALVRGLAQENGYPEDLAVAMVDPEHEFVHDSKKISKSGQLLNLTAKEAVELKDKDGKPLFVSAIVNSPEEIITLNNLQDAPKKRFEITSAEILARWITLLAPIFLLIGAAGVYIEIKTPGFGIPGITGIVFLSIFFFGHYIAGLAGMEEIVLIGIGIILLALEIFVIPGFGIAGISGIILIFGGVIMAMIPVIPAEGFEGIGKINPQYLQAALWKFTIFLVLFLVTAWLLAKLLPKTVFFSRLVLSETTAKGNSFNEETSQPKLLNCIGEALTFLRPAGIARINGERVDVVSEGPMIDAGCAIKVVAVKGRRIVVRKISVPEEE